MKFKKNDIKHSNIIIEEISRNIEEYISINYLIITLLLCNCCTLILIYITDIGSYIPEMGFIFFTIIIMMIFECCAFALVKSDPSKKLNYSDLKEENERLIQKYNLNPEDLVEEIYSLIKVRRDIKGENKRLKRKIKKLLI